MKFMPENLLAKSPAFLAVAALILAAAIAAFPQKEKATVVFSDEFNQPEDWPVDSSKWVIEEGGHGWGNNEFQYYRNSKRNVFHDGNGNLVIKAIKETPENIPNCWYGPCEYTSARLKTMDKFEATYGRFEARIRIPRGQGIWPAFWMLGSDIQEVGWPACGEIDIMENIGREPNIVHGTIHGPGYSGANGIGGQITAKVPYADDFHVYAVEWSENRIEWFVDGELYKTITPADLPAGAKWVFDHDYFILLNVAVGGNWPGSPDETTVFPQEMLIDYVRVTQNNASYRKDKDQ